MLTSDRFAKIDEFFQEHRNYDKLMSNMSRAYDTVEEIFKKYSHKVLHDNLGYNIRMEFYAMRIMSMRDLALDGAFETAKDQDLFTAGMYIVLG